MSTLGERLKEERNRLGMSQPEFAHACGVEKGSQINYEAGRRYPDAEYLNHADKLGVDVLYVVTGNRSASGRVAEVHESEPLTTGGSAVRLTVQEHALIDNYRHASDQGRRAVEAAAAALAQPSGSLKETGS